MKKNFIEVGGTYKSKNGLDWKCICVKWGRAWLVLDGSHNLSAYVFTLDGMPISHAGVETYELLPPNPKIAQNEANLWQWGGVDWRIASSHFDEGTNGKLYTHSEAGVALFVRENIDGETLAEALGALQAEIGDE